MNFCCSECQLVFEKEKKYRKHNLDFHGIKPIFECKKCAYSGPSQRALKKHEDLCESNSRMDIGN
jgi:hypothetical protein